MDLIDLKGKDPALAAAGAVIGLGVGLINGYMFLAIKVAN